MSRVPKKTGYNGKTMMKRNIRKRIKEKMRRLKNVPVKFEAKN